MRKTSMLEYSKKFISVDTHKMNYIENKKDREFVKNIQRGMLLNMFEYDGQERLASYRLNIPTKIGPYKGEENISVKEFLGRTFCGMRIVIRNKEEKNSEIPLMKYPVSYYLLMHDLTNDFRFTLVECKQGSYYIKNDKVNTLYKINENGEIYKNGILLNGECRSLLKLKEVLLDIKNVNNKCQEHRLRAVKKTESMFAPEYIDKIKRQNKTHLLTLPENEQMM